MSFPVNAQRRARYAAHFCALFSVLLLFCAPLRAHAQDTEIASLDTPIKAGGGSLTFYTKTGDWFPFNGTHNTFCTQVNDTSQILLSGFGGHLLNHATGPDWSIDLHTTQGKTLTLATVANGSCNGQTGRLVTLTVPPATGFYQDPLEKPGIHKHRRFQEKSCRPGKDADFCERLSAITLHSDGAQKRYECEDLDCSLYLGRDAQSINAAATKRRGARATPQP